MSEPESYARFVAERATSPPRTSGETLYWDGLGAASRSLSLTPASASMACAAVSPAPTVDWTTEAASVTFYMALRLLRATRGNVIPSATGTLVWVCQAEHGACITPTAHPALLVQTVSATLQGTCIELVPHLPADDPLRHHMGLVLRTAFEAEGVAGQLYAASLANALAIHFLSRYAVCGHPTHEVTGGLSPAKLHRTTAYIQAHLEQELSLALLATLVNLSPDHFARLFKHATGQTPHQYVLACRIAHAKQLLAETDLPISTISLQVGCTDQSYFTALFRKHVTMTPKAYRDAIAHS